APSDDARIALAVGQRPGRPAAGPHPGRQQLPAVPAGAISRGAVRRAFPADLREHPEPHRAHDRQCRKLLRPTPDAARDVALARVVGRPRARRELAARPAAPARAVGDAVVSLAWDAPRTARAPAPVYGPHAAHRRELRRA